MVVESIPLTTAGKTDRTALRLLLLTTRDRTPSQQKNSATAVTTVDETARPKEKEEEEEEPTTKSMTLRVATAAMAKVLGMSSDQVRNSSNKTFWELGGTSLMAMKLDGELQQQTGVRVGIATMMRDGSVEGIVKAVQEGQLSIDQRQQKQ